MIKHVYYAGRIQRSNSNVPPHPGKVHIPNPAGTDDGQIPVEEEGRGVELSN